MTNYLYPNFNFENLSQQELKTIVDKKTEEVRQTKEWRLANALFKQDGKPFEMSVGQTAIFNLITQRQHKFSEILCSTQYGKSLVVARAVLTRITTYPEDWMVVTPDTKRGRILLKYIIQDTSENDYFKAKLVGIDIKDRTVLNRLLEEKSKLKLTFQVIGEDDKIRYGSIEILTAEARRKFDTINSIMGFGGRNIINDESSLCDDEIDSGIFRMLAGKGEDTFLCKIGNPFYRNHFLESWEDEDYKKIFINDKIGIAEGRYTEDFLRKAKEKPKYDVLFGCKFPEEGSIDTEGWTPLFTETELNNAIVDDISPFGIVSLGVDPADTGEDESVNVVRWANVARISFANNKIDLIDFCGKIEESINNYKIDPRNSNVDKIGIGAMIPGKMKEQGKPINGINVAETCDLEKDEIQFINKRAKLAWDVKRWIAEGGKLERDDRWKELLNIRYKEDNKRRMKLMSKEEMRKRGVKSPNAFDALSYTFARKPVVYKDSLAEVDFQKMLKRKRAKKVNARLTGY